MDGQDIILSQSEYESLLEEVHRLQARISELTALRDDLRYHVCPALRAEYEEKIASVEREILAAEMYLRENQRILEILQARANRKEKMSFEEAQKEAHKEFEDYEEDLKRKAKEAEDFRKSWEEDSGWSEHDRKEKEARQSQKQDAREEKEAQQSQKQDDPEEKEARQSRKKDGGKRSAEDRAQDSDEKHSSAEDRIGAEDDPEHDDEASGTGENGSSEKKRGTDDAADAGENGSYDEERGTEDDPGDSGAPESPARKLKSLYRKIVKRLHPDVHPNSTEREKELFNMAQTAMKTGDLDLMEHIYEELLGMDAPEERFADTPEGIASLKELIEKLKARMRSLQQEIQGIRSVFPYTMKSFLEDEDAVQARRQELQDKLKNLREANEKLAAFIRQMKQQMGI